jgi:hypothetical protein
MNGNGSCGADTPVRRLARVGRTLLSVAFDLGLDLESPFKRLAHGPRPEREGHDFQSCRSKPPKIAALAAEVRSLKHTPAAESRIFRGLLFGAIGTGALPGSAFSNCRHVPSLPSLFPSAKLTTDLSRETEN